MILTKKQEEGLKIAVARYKAGEKYTIISGYAGSGKSTLVRFIIEALGVEEKQTIMKTYHIDTWGGGTPHYLVSAETKEEAWKMVEQEWRKTYGNRYYFVGQVLNGQYQTKDDLVEIVGLTTQTSMIIDLNEEL